MKELLSYRAVEISYNGIPAVRDVSFTLQPGEILGIVGESGSGKSSLIRAALGILGQGGQVTRGEIRYRDRNLPELTEKELRKIRGAGIGMIFQDAGSSLCPVRTIGSQIFESLSAHRRITRQESDTEALELFTRLGFREGERILASYPFELSGGMNQRVGIAMAMLLKPEILLADEPTSALDVSIQRQAVEELLLLRELYGTALVLVTHNLGVVRGHGGYCADLKGGGGCGVRTGPSGAGGSPGRIYQGAAGRCAGAGENIDGSIAGSEKSYENISEKRAGGTGRCGPCKLLPGFRGDPGDRGGIRFRKKYRGQNGRRAVGTLGGGDLSGRKRDHPPEASGAAPGIPAAADGLSVSCGIL